MDGSKQAQEVSLNQPQHSCRRYGKRVVRLYRTKGIKKTDARLLIWDGLTILPSEGRIGGHSYTSGSDKKRKHISRDKRKLSQKLSYYMYEDEESGTLVQIRIPCLRLTAVGLIYGRCREAVLRTGQQKKCGHTAIIPTIE